MIRKCLERKGNEELKTDSKWIGNEKEIKNKLQHEKEMRR